MQITVKSVNVEWISKGKTKYGKAVVSYVRDGKDNTQTLVSFKNPDVFKTLSEASEGSVYEITLTKEGDYWQWSKASPVGLQPPSSQASTTQAPAATGGRVTGSNYETPAERAARQVLIVKQSSLAQAIEYYKIPNITGTEAVQYPEDILNLAQKFADWVFATKQQDLFEDVPNDL